MEEEKRKREEQWKMKKKKRKKRIKKILKKDQRISHQLMTKNDFLLQKGFFSERFIYKKKKKSKIRHQKIIFIV
jgi:hypothetical protein